MGGPPAGARRHWSLKTYLATLTGLFVAVAAVDVVVGGEATDTSIRTGVTALGLLLFLATSFLLHRRLVRPIGHLRSEVRADAALHTPAPLPIEGPAEVAALARDLNAMMNAAHREQIVNSRLAAIVDSAADAILAKDLEGVITAWNPSAARMYGYEESEIVGRNVAVLFPPDLSDEQTMILQRVRQGDRIELETRRLRKDGTTFDAAVTVSPIRDASGAVVGASTVSRDHTERNRAAAAQRDLEERLRQAERLESLGQLAGGIAHDFNNLLAAITNYAQFVADETKDRPAVRGDVEQIQIACERAARLIKQLLIFSRREAIRPEVLDLNTTVDGVRRLLERTIGEHIELKVELEPELPTVRADRGQLEQVLVNLAVNARDAMAGGGTLTVRTRAVEIDDDRASTATAVPLGRYVELTVSDTGTGMADEVARHVFEPFFTTKPAGKGTGLGLATVYGIVTDAGGTISVQTREGAGTELRVLLPADGGPVAEHERTTEPQRGNGGTILVVEDDAPVLEVTSRILRRGGYAVLQARTYDQALTLAASTAFDLLLTDSVMPQMSGQELVSRIDALRPGRPVLFMSGYRSDVAGQAGPRHRGPLIKKPFDARTLLNAVSKALANERRGPRMDSP